MQWAGSGMRVGATIGLAAVLVLGAAGAKAEAQAPATKPVPDFDYTVGPVPKGDTPSQAAPPLVSPRQARPRPAAPPPAAVERRAPRPPVAKRIARAPTRIIVRPVRPVPGLPNRHDSTEFPRSDNLGFPGRNAVRQCKSW